MIGVALILLAIVILFTVAVVISNPALVDLSIFGASVKVQTPAIFFTGAGTMLVLMVALILLRVGIRRDLLRRKQARATRKAARADATAARSSGSANAGTPIAAVSADRSGTSAPAPVGTAGSTGSPGPAPVSPAPARPSSAGSASAGSASADPARAASGTAPVASSPDGSGSTAAERQAWLAEVDDITGDDSRR